MNDFDISADGAESAKDGPGTRAETAEGAPEGHPEDTADAARGTVGENGGRSSGAGESGPYPDGYGAAGGAARMGALPGGAPTPPPMTPAIAEQLRVISAYDPAIRGPGDLLRMECYPRFYELVRRGNSFVDAYRLANFDALTARAAESGRQAARTYAASKQHLLRTQTRGTDTVSVPAEIRDGYRAMNPGISDAEIARHYGRYVASLRAREF